MIGTHGANLLENLDAVGAFVKQQPAGLMTDFDGTISQIASRPGDARVDPGCLLSLAALRKNMALIAVVSGRPAREVADLVGLDGVIYVGSHGFETLSDAGYTVDDRASQYVEAIRRIVRHIQAQGPIDGLIFEDKGIGSSIHYRLAAHGDSIRQHLLNLIARTEEAKSIRVREGRKVIELLPPLDVDKSKALRHLVERRSLRSALVFGDDRTDVDAFRALRQLRAERALNGLAIGVVGTESPDDVMRAADYILRGVTQVRQFLQWLAGVPP